MTTEEARALYEKHGSLAKAAAAGGVAKSTIFKALHRTAGKVADHGPAAVAAKGKTLADFRAQYDKSFIVPTRVKEGLKRLGAAGWEYEVDFAKAANVSLADLGRFRDAFADYIVVLGREGRRAWAGSKATAAQMREMLA